MSQANPRKENRSAAQCEAQHLHGDWSKQFVRDLEQSGAPLDLDTLKRSPWCTQKQRKRSCFIIWCWMVLVNELRSMLNYFWRSAVFWCQSMSWAQATSCRCWRLVAWYNRLCDSYTLYVATYCYILAIDWYWFILHNMNYCRLI